MIVAIDTNILIKAFKDSEYEHNRVLYSPELKLGCDYDSDRVILREYEKK